MTIGMISSLEGIQRAQSQFNQAANNIAHWPGPATSAPQGDQVDLSDQAIALIQAKNSFEANTAALKVSDSMTETLLQSIK